jgi:hypothetical protein
MATRLRAVQIQQPSEECHLNGLEELMAAQDPQREARIWFEKLGTSPVTTADVHAFGRWRDEPANDAAYTALELGLEEQPRYVVRPMTEQYKVVDQWTGQTVMTNGQGLVDLEESAARRFAARMNAQEKRR